MTRNATINDLYLDAIALGKVVKTNEKYSVAVRFDEDDRFSVHLMDRRNLETLYREEVENVSHNVINGFIAIASVVGFMDGYNRASEVEFGPLEEVKKEAK